MLQLPQSTVSRHLKTLADVEWVTSRREGTSRYYTLASTPQDRRRGGSGTAARAGDRRRRRQTRTRAGSRACSRAGRTASQQFFASAAGRWDKLRSDLFGTASAPARAGRPCSSERLDGRRSGLRAPGQVAAALAPFVSRVIAVDRSGDMLQAARRRLREWPNVEVRRGELEALPIDDGTLDAATLMLVLHHRARSCGRADATPRASCKPGGRLLIATCCRTTARSTGVRWGTSGWGSPKTRCGGCWPARGSRSTRIVPLPADPDAKGPALFVASRRPGNDTFNESRVQECASLSVKEVAR